MLTTMGRGCAYEETGLAGEIGSCPAYGTTARLVDLIDTVRRRAGAVHGDINGDRGMRPTILASLGCTAARLYRNI